MTRLVSTLKTQLVGRQQLHVIVTSGSGNVTFASLPLDPVSVGDRPTSLAGAFERYRILRMAIHYRAFAPSTFTGTFLFGVHDDTASSGPTAPDQVLNLRNSREVSVWKDASISYVPIDKNKWYYCNAESGGDPRFVTQAVLYYGTSTIVSIPGNAAGTYSTAVAAGVNIGEFTLEYHYVFDGATIVGD